MAAGRQRRNQPNVTVNGQREPAPGQRFSNWVSNSNFCSRCLSVDHPRSHCNRPIRCLACRGWGHIAQACMAPTNQSTEQEQAAGELPRPENPQRNRGKDTVPVDVSGWFSNPNGPNTSQPYIFRFQQSTTVPWMLPVSPDAEGTIDGPHPTHWTLITQPDAAAPNYYSTSPATAPTPQEENPGVPQSHLLATPHSLPNSHHRVRHRRRQWRSNALIHVLSSQRTSSGWKWRTASRWCGRSLHQGLHRGTRIWQSSTLIISLVMRSTSPQ